MGNILKLLDFVIAGIQLKDNMEEAYLRALELVKIATNEGRDITAEELQEIDLAIDEEYNKWRNH